METLFKIVICSFVAFAATGFTFSAFALLALYTPFNPSVVFAGLGSLAAGYWASIETWRRLK